MTAYRDGIITTRRPLPYGLGAMGTMIIGNLFHLKKSIQYQRQKLKSTIICIP
jgi:hypothetical protein